MRKKQQAMMWGLIVVLALAGGGATYWWSKEEEQQRVVAPKTALQQVRGYKHMGQLSSAFTPMYSQFFTSTVEKNEHSIMEFKKDEWYTVSDDIGYFLNVVHDPTEDRWTIELTKPTAIQSETVQQFVSLIYGKSNQATVLKQWESLFNNDKATQRGNVVLNGKVSTISYQQLSGVPTLHVAVKQRKG